MSRTVHNRCAPQEFSLYVSGCVSNSQNSQSYINMYLFTEKSYLSAAYIYFAMRHPGFFSAVWPMRAKCGEPKI